MVLSLFISAVIVKALRKLNWISRRKCDQPFAIRHSIESLYCMGSSDPGLFRPPRGYEPQLVTRSLPTVVTHSQVGE
jgi:hypothetical protein